MGQHRANKFGLTRTNDVELSSLLLILSMQVMNKNYYISTCNNACLQTEWKLWIADIHKHRTFTSCTDILSFEKACDMTGNLAKIIQIHFLIDEELYKFVKLYFHADVIIICIFVGGPKLQNCKLQLDAVYVFHK